jgi:phosphopantetheinyl transferase (holo-ACP synthase)
VSVGNDVVDLVDPETLLSGLHPRFDERVFCAGERAALGASRSRHLLHWALWAAKESVYKARKRLEPSLVFSPKDFEVELAPRPVAGAQGTATGQVFHRGDVFDLEIRFDGSSVHAVARSRDAAGARILSLVERSMDEPGRAARRLAATAIGTALGLEPDELRIVGRPPVARHRGRVLDATVSLSHHGRFVAFACALPLALALGAEAASLLTWDRRLGAAARAIGLGVFPGGV